MPTYFGFSSLKNRTTAAVSSTNKTVGATTTGYYGGAANSTPSINSGKYTLIDNELVIQDLINAFNIPQGQKPGNPGYGTLIWQMLFEQNTPALESDIQDEVTRIIELDSRIVLNSVTVTSDNNTIVAQIMMALTPSNQVYDLRIKFDQESSMASLIQ